MEKFMLWGIKTINLFTDGACSGNPGPGGWGVYSQLPEDIEYRSLKEIKEYNSYNKTTNQQMELVAAANALKIALELTIGNKQPLTININTDSAYLCNGMNNKWYVNWLKNGWKNAKKEPVANQTEWELILNYRDALLLQQCMVNFIKVAGHSNNLGNEMADALACLGRDFAMGARGK
jgi:ribonuclease HI